jgi:cysteine synthase A
VVQTSFTDIPGVRLYLKDESAQPTGSLKHRLARSLFLSALCNGLIGPDTTIVECSSGSTAVSEAYFARLLGLRFIAVAPLTTADAKVAQVERYGGECRLVPALEIHAEAQALAARTGGHFMDQFTNAAQVTDFRYGDNIASAFFKQLIALGVDAPDWVVLGAGTGGTATTFGRYIRQAPAATTTRLCVADPEHSVFLDYFQTGNRDVTSDRGSLIEGIGRPRVEPSFQPQVIDRMMRIPDAASVSAARWISDRLDRKCGGSTGTNVWCARQIALEMQAEGRTGSIATLICDHGDRYLSTYFCDRWVSERNFDIESAAF